jgi:type VI secretion system secreted protein VgrG
MTEHATLTLGGAALEVVDVDGREAVSELYRIDVRCRTMGQAPRPKAIAGGEALLALFDSFGSTRSVNAIVSRAKTSFHHDGSIWLTAELRPAAWLLTRGRNCRSFQEMNVVEIVSEVLAGVPHRWETAGSFAVRPYTVQYRENDWSFACRLLEQEGIHFWFDHDAGSELVLSDSSTSAPDLEGGARIEVHDKSGLTRDHEVIEELGAIASVVPTAFAIKSFNPRNPALQVSGTSGGGPLEIYDAPGGGPTDPAAAAALADRLHKAAVAAGLGVGATTNSVRIYPGRVVAPVGHASLDGRYFVTRIDYTVRQRRRDGGSTDRPWSCHFAGIAADTPFVPPQATPQPRQAGIQSGEVTGPPGEEIYPNEHGEVRVEQHWDRFGSGDDKGGTWMRVAQRGTSESMQLPRIGWNVLTFNEEGSVDAPNVLSRVNDGEHPPAYKLPENKTRVVFKTATTPANGTFNEIYFEDIKGAEEMFINASRDMNVLVQQIKNEGVGNDSTRKVGNDHKLTVADDTAEEIDRDQTVSIGGNDTLTVGATRSEQVGGNLTMTIGGNRSIDVGEAHSDSVKITRDLAVGAALIDTSLGTIAGRGDLVTMLVGGAQLKMSAKSVVDSHGGVSVQTIGGAKIEITKKARLLDVEKYLFETVGGAIVIKADGSYTDAAETTSSWTVGADLATGTTDLVVRAQDKIEIICGDSSLTLLPDSVEINTPELDLGKAKVVETETPLVEHNS